MCFAAAPIVSPSRPACGFFLFPPHLRSPPLKKRGRGKKRGGKKKEGRTAAWMLNLGVIFRAVRLWISVLTVSENELFRFRLAASASPLPALTLSLSLSHAIPLCSLFIFFSAASSLSTSIFSLTVSNARSVSSLLPP